MILLLLLFNISNAGNIPTHLRAYFRWLQNREFNPVIQGQILDRSPPSSSSGSIPQSHHSEQETFPDINPCQIELGEDRNGRYPRLISAEFMTGMVSPVPLHRSPISPSYGNLVCTCESHLIMICTIFVDEGSLVEVAVDMRLNRENPVDLHPFFVINQNLPESSQSSIDRSLSPLGFEAPGDYEPPVRARIVICRGPPIPDISSGSELNAHFKLDHSTSVPNMRCAPTLRRVKSSPSALHYSENRIPLCLCSGVCPITQNTFKPNDMVYVLKAESHNVALRKSIGCISALGLKQLAQRSFEGTFGDPLRRVEQTDLTVEQSYDTYVMYDDLSA